VVDLDTVKLSVIPYATDALGPFYGYSESSTGVTRGIRWAEHRDGISAHQYVGMGAGAASGIALVAHTDMGYINVSRFAPNLWFGDGSSTRPESTAVSIAVTPTVMDFAIVAGVDYLTGSSIETSDSFDATTTPVTPGGTVYTRKDTNAVGVSAQAHGELAGMEAGFYASWAKAAAGAESLYAKEDGARKAFALGADFTVIPHTLSLGAAYRGASTGAAGSNDDAVTLTAVYDLAQNVAFHADWSSYKDNQGKNGANGDSLFTGMLEAAW